MLVTAKTKGLILTGLLLLLVVISSTLLYAQSNTGKPIRRMTGDYLPAGVPPDKVMIPESGVFSGKYFKLIQFAQIPEDSKRRSWADAGLQLVDYLPEDTYFAVIDVGFDLNQLAGEALTIIDVDDLFKMDPELAYRRAQGELIDQLVLSYYATLDPVSVMADLRTRGVDVDRRLDYARQLYVTIHPAQLNAVLALPYVQFAGLWPAQGEAEDYIRSASGRANYVNSGYNGLTYQGSGVVIAIGEDGTVDNHIDTKGRLIEMMSGDPSSHKIHVMIEAAAGANADATDLNNAWGATVLSVGGDPDYAGLFASHDLRFTNHSLGYGIVAGYDSVARSLDLLASAYGKAMVIYSSGNSGTSVGYPPYDGFSGWANITGQRKQNKNQLAIRNVNSDESLVTSGSIGPAYDGRILPHTTIEGAGGTSLAAPKVTGSLAILSQIYRDRHSGAEPSAMLLRAILMNTADELDDPGPDFRTGYGRPNLRRAHGVIDSGQFLTATVANGNTNLHTIVVPANTSQVRVMLMWPDVAASVGASSAIVNNLNLVGADPGSTSYNPWVLDPSPNPAILDLPATRQVDNLNTMEQVTVDNPTPGVWTFSVTGANVPMGPQQYFIVYEFLTDELHVGFPLHDARFVPGATYYLKWDSYGGTGTFDLAYQLDGGSWTNIVTGHDAASRSYTWVAPAVGTGIHTLKFRVTRGGLSAESDLNTIGAVPSNLTIGWACGPSARLTWGDVAGASAYKVYRLGSQYMAEVTTHITFDGASAILDGLSTTEAESFAVSAVTGAHEGLRANAVTKVGDVNCFYTRTTTANSVNKTSLTLRGLVNPHNTTLTEVHFEYGPTDAYGMSTPNIPTSATGHTEEGISSSIASPLVSRTDLLHYRLVALSDGAPVYGADQIVRLAPGNDFTFDGADDYIDVSDHATLPVYRRGVGTAYSIAMWIKGSPQNAKRLYSEASSTDIDPRLAIQTYTDGKLWVFIRDDNGVVLRNNLSVGVALDNTWHFVTFVDANGSAKLYIDGIQDQSFTYTPGPMTLDQATIGALFRASASDFFNGRIEQVSVWDKALTLAEIRDMLHQPLQGSEAGLKAYYDWDESFNEVFDVVSGDEGMIIGGVANTSSTAPTGVGVEFTTTEANGLVTFTGTGLAANYSSQNGATVIVSRIDVAPNSLSGLSGDLTPLDEQYWVTHRSGTSSFTANVTFTVAEDLTASDEATPAQVQLFYRDQGADGDWAFLAAASSVDAATDQATFNGLTAFKRQFIIARNTEPSITVDTNSLAFSNVKVGCVAYQQLSYALTGLNLATNLEVTPPAGFLVSTDASSGFAPSLSLTPSNTLVSATIYVRLMADSPGAFSGDVVNSSPGATSALVDIPQIEVLNVATSATRMLSFDGVDDYLDVQGFNWNPNSAFTVEWWLKPTARLDWNQQIGNGWGSFLFYTNSSGMVSVGVADNSWSRIDTAADTLVVGEWQHFAFTLNGAQARLYRNGELVGELLASDGLNATWGHFEIGKDSSNTLAGQIDEFRIWSTARTQQEIQDDMHNVLAGSEAGLQLYLQFNAQAGNVVDFANGCYDVTTNNGPTRAISTAPVGAVGALVDTQTPTAVGEPGKQLTVTITSTPSTADYLGIYRTGAGDTQITNEIFPGDVKKRANILWGIHEFGDVTATLVINYANVVGVSDPTLLRVLKRADATGNWVDVTADFVHDPMAHTFTRTGNTEFSEFTIGNTGTPLAVRLGQLTLTDAATPWLFGLLLAASVLWLGTVWRLARRRRRGSEKVW